jgi:hypothetical protein
LPPGVGGGLSSRVPAAAAAPRHIQAAPRPRLVTAPPGSTLKQTPKTRQLQPQLLRYAGSAAVPRGGGPVHGGSTRHVDVMVAMNPGDPDKKESRADRKERNSRKRALVSSAFHHCRPVDIHARAVVSRCCAR